VSDSEWRKPSTCSTDRACVEVRRPEMGGVNIRASEDPKPRLYFYAEEWAEFVAAVKNGEYDYDQGGQ